MRCNVEKSEQVYIKLQKHLNNQAVGFPATKTGVEIRILKHIFTPEEAEAYVAIPKGYHSADSIAKEFGKDEKEVTNIL